ncbi:restriction endonuclease [Luteimonas yindakuii]|uniref:Restriction endonuclease n=1 Tax=Luteimonas yindakuii TaxID=2565782 RepID=A0A4Z1RBV8_9GAMM|nr:restriction endonuclease [Luteimonas yindakuii]
MSARGLSRSPPMTRAKHHRSVAFHAQGGRCYYCSQPMWLSDHVSFAQRHRISTAQARQLQCTAEHLQPKATGGTLCRSNVVAACLFCNRTRGKVSPAPEPQKFRQRVRARCNSGKWHSLS